MEKNPNKGKPKPRQ